VARRQKSAMSIVVIAVAPRAASALARIAVRVEP
jgi:hypothetical protein